jgi:hypothetical protein
MTLDCDLDLDMYLSYRLVDPPTLRQQSYPSSVEYANFLSSGIELSGILSFIS